MNLLSVFKKHKTTIFHIGPRKLDGHKIILQGAEYIFFPTKPFLEDDNIIGMWDRIFGQLSKKRADIILVHLHKPNMINDYEEEKLRKFGIVLKLSDV